jgi:hypothetical protein
VSKDDVLLATVGGGSFGFVVAMVVWFVAGCAL